MKRNLFIQWDSSNDCNLRCSHCYHLHKESEQLDVKMPISEVKLMIDDLYETSQRWSSKKENRFFKPRFQISGGEPLVRSDLNEILLYTKKYNIETRLLTNGTLITDKRAKELKKLGINMLQISIDGNREIHNKIRGREGRYYAYDKALEGIRNCANNGIIVTTSMTLMNSNKHTFKDVVDASEKNGASFCGFQSYIPYGAEDPEFVGPKETYKMFKEARELDRKHKKIVVLQTEVLWHLMRTDSLEKKLARKNGYYSGGCSAGYTGVAVLADGTVYPCRRLPLPIGHISEGLSKLITETPLMKDLRNFNKLETNCEHKPYCRGCRAVAYAKTGNLFSEDPMCFKDFVKKGDLTDLREGLIYNGTKE